MGNVGELIFPVVANIEYLIRVVEVAQIRPERNRISELSREIKISALLLAIEISADL